MGCISKNERILTDGKGLDSKFVKNRKKNRLFQANEASMAYFCVHV